MDRRTISEAFSAHFGHTCEAVARAPGRVNLIGEHTDYNDGYVLPIALEFCTWVGCARRQDGVAHVVALDLSDEQAWPLDDWNAEDRPHWTSYVAGVANLLRTRGAPLDGFDLLIRSQVPVGGGLSSSAALEVATALALTSITGAYLAPTELADLCREAEHTFAGVPCGIMDQYVSVLGRADTALLLDCRSRTHEHIPFVLDRHVVMIVDSGVRHELAGGEYARRQAECRRAVEHFRIHDAQVRALRDVSAETVREHASRMEPLAAARSRHVTTEIQRTLAAGQALRHGDLAELGRLMSASHRSLRDDYQVSCPELDRLVEILCGLDGMLGARLTGGGFGGCVVAIARQESVAPIEHALRARYDPTVSTPARLMLTRPGPGAALELPRNPKAAPAADRPAGGPEPSDE
jgi:galactokinase